MTTPTSQRQPAPAVAQQGEALDKARAPYGFVPLSEHVFLPPWADQVGHDWPLQGALRGTFTLRIEAESPIFTRGEAEREQVDGKSRQVWQPLRWADGRWGLPATSVKGALRNVIEIASFGWLRGASERPFGVRDINDGSTDGYRERVSHVGSSAGGGKSTHMPRVVAAWMRKAGGYGVHSEDGSGPPWATLDLCDFARIDYETLEKLAARRGVQQFQPGQRQEASEKYNAWKDRSRSDVRVRVDWVRGHGVVRSSRFEGLRFGRVTELEDHADLRGTLVFTGQPSRWSPGAKGAKRHDYLFFTAAKPVDPVEVRQADFARFEQVHAATGQQHRLTGQLDPAGNWKHHQGDFLRGEPIPVFVLFGSNDSVEAIGLTPMLRLPGALTPRRAVENVQKGLGDPERCHRPDLAEALFGYVGLGRPGNGGMGDALRGRVWFGRGVATADTGLLDPVRAVLSSPRPSYYPAYLEQGGRDGRPLGSAAPPRRPGKEFADGKAAYGTWLDRDARARGWKRYRPRYGAPITPELPKSGKGRGRETLVDSATITTFRPLAAGTTFEVPVAAHNVLPEELGALVWAVRFGGHDDARHQLGMGRPLGYGKVRIRIEDWQIHEAPGPVGEAPREVSAADCERAFEACMERWARGADGPGQWRQSEQIRELLALATPRQDADDDLRNMSIAPPNEFEQVKLRGHVIPMAIAPERAIGTSQPGHANAHGAGGPRSPSSRQAPAPAPARTSAHGSWQPIPSGKVVTVRLTGKSKKGKWTFELTSEFAQGRTQTSGSFIEECFADASEGDTVQAIVTAGRNPTGLNAKAPRPSG